jgi:hypothetical protein
MIKIRQYLHDDLKSRKSFSNSLSLSLRVKICVLISPQPQAILVWLVTALPPSEGSRLRLIGNTQSRGRRPPPPHLDIEVLRHLEVSEVSTSRSGHALEYKPQQLQPYHA